jgi:hypothetical protein
MRLNVPLGRRVCAERGSRLAMRDVCATRHARSAVCDPCAKTKAMLERPSRSSAALEPRPCEIILDASDFDREIDLDAVLKKLESFAPVVPAGSNDTYAAQPGGDWGELEGKIVRGENLHESINRLAMKCSRAAPPKSSPCRSYAG